MSKITYTDGSCTILGVCYCGKTACECGSVVNFLGEDMFKERGLFDIENLLKEILKN